MADKKISQLTAAAALTGTEVVPIVQSGDTVKTTVQDIANRASLGFTPENVANKSINTALGTSDTLYPTQNAVKVYVDGSVAGLLDDRGSYTPSVSSPGAYPSTGGSGTAGAIMKGDLWFMSASGFLGTTAVAAGATVRALVNTPGQTAANWNILSAGAISITTPTLQQVTTAGAVSTNDISVQTGANGSIGVFSTFNSGNASIGVATFSGGFLSVRNTTGQVAEIYGSNLTSNRVLQLPNAAGTLALTSQVGLPYLVYSALGTYSSGGVFVNSLLYNTLGATITWSSGLGYTAKATASASVFTNGKTVVTATPYYGNNISYINTGFRVSGTEVGLLSVRTDNNSTAAAYDGTFLIEIRVYP